MQFISFSLSLFQVRTKHLRWVRTRTKSALTQRSLCPSSQCEPSVSELGENTDERPFRSPEKQASLRWVRRRSKSTLTNGHFAMQRPLSGTGCQKHSTKQRTLRLLGGSNQVSLAHLFFFTPHPFPPKLAPSPHPSPPPLPPTLFPSSSPGATRLWWSTWS